MRLPFFVYGTLKRGEPNYARYLAGHTVAEEPAHLPDAALYTAGPYPFLVTSPGPVAPGDAVQGSLISIRDSEYDAVLANLDSLEGYLPGGRANLYERVVTIVQTSGGPREAWIYIAGTGALEQIERGELRKIAGGIWRSGADAVY